MGNTKSVLFCHGLESGPHGSKYRALVDAGYNVLAPDCRGMNLKQRVALVADILKVERPFVVGSSYGGITAILAAVTAGVTLPGLVLCAPALEREEEPNTDPGSLPLVGPTVIVHGVSDEVIPLGVSESYASRTGATLVRVQDGHRLENSVPEILNALRSLTK